MASAPSGPRNESCGRSETSGSAPSPRLRCYAWQTTYPKAYFGAVLDAATPHGLDPWLLLALSREESRFDPDIVSWAGATGLTQLMPATALGAFAALPKARRPPSYSPELLKDPELNLRLGASVLAESSRRFEDIPLGIAAYNAGPGLVAGFLRRSGHLPFDRFVLAIRVAETRGYLQRVLESWARYRLLYASDDPFIPMPSRY
ncbi:MAG: lytic transglycosylase domain-containing protein [Myxococcales bacterium]|nr:lytic transglycosylase domain-containing protein [Myxococcales bacterium]